jgi:hypothetical protein
MGLALFSSSKNPWKTLRLESRKTFCPSYVSLLKHVILHPCMASDYLLPALEIQNESKFHSRLRPFF